GHCRRPDLPWHARTCLHGCPQAARDHRVGAAWKIRQAALAEPAAMASKPRSTGTTEIELFLDMLAAERGAGPNTLTAYTRDLEDFSDYLVAKKRTIADAATEHVRGYLRHLAKREFAAASVARRL